MSTERKQITVSQILNDLTNGLTRKEIKEKYELTGAGMRRLFQNEKLKNKKTHKGVDFDLVDDTVEEETPDAEPAIQEEVIGETLPEELPEENEIEMAEIPDVPETTSKGLFD